MRKRFKKSIIAIIMVIAMIGITACARDNGNTKDNTTKDNSNTGDNTPNDATVEGNVGNQTENGNILDEYNTLLQTESNRDNIYGYIDKNITNASEAEADQLIGGVLGYEDTYEDVDYARLYAYKNYVSDEVEDFLELMYENQEKPYMSGNQLGVTLDELLDRAEDFEEHITDFPKGITTQHAYDMYVKLMNAAIVGGYDKENNVASYYKGDAENRIDGRAVDEYMRFLADEEDDDDKTVKINNSNNTNTNNASDTNTNNTNANNDNNTNGNNTNNTNTNNARTNNTNNSNGNNTNTNNTTGNNTTTNNTTVNVGDSSEEDYDAPITRSIVQEYVDLLAKNKNEITKEVEDFYANLSSLISQKFGM